MRKSDDGHPCSWVSAIVHACIAADGDVHAVSELADRAGRTRCPARCHFSISPGAVDETAVSPSEASMASPDAESLELPSST